MKNAQKPDHMSLNTLIGRLREGRFVIPDFQREFEWKPWDIRELMRSIFLDYYIGSLLLWKGKKENFKALSCEPIYGFNGKEQSEYIVLDGQQRLTALYYAFLAPDIPLPSRSNRAVYFVRVDKFMNEEYDEAFHYDWLSKRLAKILDDREAQFAEHVFPLPVIGATGWELPNWVQDYELYWRKVAEQDDSDAELAVQHANNAKAFGKHLREITEQYQVSYIELDQELELDQSLRHLHPDQQPRRPSRCLRPNQRATDTQGSATQAYVARCASTPGVRRLRKNERLHFASDVDPSASLLLAEIPLLLDARAGKAGS